MTASAFTDDRINSALDSLTLPDGVSLVDEQDIPNIDNHPLIDVVVRLCNQFQDASHSIRPATQGRSETFGSTPTKCIEPRPTSPPA
jgi:hypothetical protein